MGSIDWACGRCGDKGRSLDALAMCPTCHAPLAGGPVFQVGDVVRVKEGFDDGLTGDVGTVVGVLEGFEGVGYYVALGEKKYTYPLLEYVGSQIFGRLIGGEHLAWVPSSPPKPRTYCVRITYHIEVEAESEEEAAWKASDHLRDPERDDWEADVDVTDMTEDGCPPEDHDCHHD